MLHERADRRCEASDIAKSKSFETGTRRERCESSSDRASFSTKASLRAHNTRSRRLVQERQGHWIASQLAHCSTGLDCFRIVSHSAVADQHQHVAPTAENKGECLTSHLEKNFTIHVSPSVTSASNSDILQTLNLYHNLSPK